MLERVETSGEATAKEGKWGPNSMQCYLTNQTGAKITGVYACHEWDDKTQPQTADELGDGDYRSWWIDVGSGGHDLWSVSFTDASGRFWYRHNKQCDITADDLSSGRAVYLNLGPGSMGFSVSLPYSSSCNNNFYNGGYHGGPNDAP
jgi:hypothetical protein